MNLAHELDRNRQLCAALEVDALMARMRRPAVVGRAEWAVAAWFCAGYAAVLGVSCWVAFTPSGRAFLDALRGLLA